VGIKGWSKMPTEWVRNGTIKEFTYQGGSTGTASLMLYFILCHYAEVFSPSNSGPVSVAQVTYTKMAELASLSRKLVSSGLDKLEAVGMITRVGSRHFGAYRLNGLTTGKGWVKLPGKPLLSEGGTTFSPFECFKLRNKHELNAMKMYLYYAAIRDEYTPYSEVSFETIYSKTGVAERHIPAANSLLVSSRLLDRITRDFHPAMKQYEANKYYMTGYKALVRTESASI
jgi:hypothetical protein